MWMISSSSKYRRRRWIAVSSAERDAAAVRPAHISLERRDKGIDPLRAVRRILSNAIGVRVRVVTSSAFDDVNSKAPNVRTTNGHGQTGPASSIGGSSAR